MNHSILPPVPLASLKVLILLLHIKIDCNYIIIILLYIGDPGSKSFCIKLPVPNSIVGRTPQVSKYTECFDFTYI